MKFYSNFFDINSAFRKIDDVKATISTSKNYQNEPIKNAKTLNFFNTSKQRSYLVSTDEMVYCIVDDIRADKPTINWSEKKSDFRTKAISVKSNTDTTGIIDFGKDHQNWLYTTYNFENDADLKEQVLNLLSDSEDTSHS